MKNTGPVLAICASAGMMALASDLLLIYYNSAQDQSYATTVYTNAAGEFWPEVALLVGLIVFGAAIIVTQYLFLWRDR